MSENNKGKYPEVDAAVLKMFTEDIENLALNSIDKDNFNSNDIERTILFYKTLIKYSKNIIKIYIDYSNIDIFNNNDIFQEINSFLLNGGKLEINLYEYKDYVKNNIFILLDKFPYDVIIKGTNRNLHTQTENENHVNFIVSDSKMFYFEIDVIDKTARVNFNSPENSIILSERFDIVFNESETIHFNLSLNI